MPPAALDQLREDLSKDAVKTALLDEVVAAIEAEDTQGVYLETVDYEEALNQADMAVTGGVKRKAAAKVAAVAVLHTAKTNAPKMATSSKSSVTPAKPPAVPTAAPAVPVALSIPAAPLVLPMAMPVEGTASESLWESLAGFHAGLVDYTSIRVYFIEGDLWNESGRLVCNASIGEGVMSTLRMEPANPRGGFLACLVPTFYSGVLEAVLAGLSAGSAVTGGFGILIAYLLSALMYLVVVKNADPVASAQEVDVFNDDCRFSPRERLQYAMIGIACLALFDLVLGFQLRASLLTTPFYAVKGLLAILMLMHTHALTKQMESTSANAALYLA